MSKRDHGNLAYDVVSTIALVDALNAGQPHADALKDLEAFLERNDA